MVLQAFPSPGCEEWRPQHPLLRRYVRYVAPESWSLSLSLEKISWPPLTRSDPLRLAFHCLSVSKIPQLFHASPLMTFVPGSQQWEHSEVIAHSATNLTVAHCSNWRRSGVMGLHHVACRLGCVKLDKVTVIVSNETGFIPKFGKCCSVVSRFSYLIIEILMWPN